MRKVQIRFILIIAAELFAGVFLAWMDTSPHWDDTGITIGLLLALSALGGFLAHRKAWLIAIAIGFWIPIFNVIMAHNYGAIMALAIAFIGAYSGNFLWRWMFTRS